VPALGIRMLPREMGRALPPAGERLLPLTGTSSRTKREYVRFIFAGRSCSPENHLMCIVKTAFRYIVKGRYCFLFDCN